MISLFTSTATSERFSTREIILAHPFTLGEDPEVYAAGRYEIETCEQVVDVAGHTAQVRTSCVLVIPTLTGSYCRTVPPQELDFAIAADLARGLHNAQSENPDRAE